MKDSTEGRPPSPASSPAADAPTDQAPLAELAEDATAPDPAAAEPPPLVDVGVLAGWLGLTPAEPVPAPPPGPVFDRRADPGRVILLDVRYAVSGAGGSGHDAYLRGHLPGAVFVSLPNQLAGHAGPRQGRHPLPDPVQFAHSLRMWGIDDGDTVVVYDDDRSLAAARAWWLLRHAGLRDSVLLDGGLGAWRAAGLPLQPGEVIPQPGSVHPSWGRMPVVDTDGAEAIAAGGLLLDARSAERYRGEEEPLDPVAGHIPGARSLPTSGNVAAHGRLLDPAALAARFEDAGLSNEVPAAVYCGSGATAAHQVLALAVAGRHGVALYPGSWSAWIQDPDRPVATGPRPEGD